MRGPMATKVVNQLINKTDWGNLDLLILDLPPGTGDIPLTITQSVPLSGVISVTTPSKLSLVDARKGVELFDSMDIPTLALVENMSYLKLKDGQTVFPFGTGMTVGNEFGGSIPEERLVRLPLSAMCSEGNETGIPMMVSRPQENDDDALEVRAFDELACLISKELLLIQYNRRLQDNNNNNNDDDNAVVSFKDEKFRLDTLHLSAQNDSQQFTMRLFSEDGCTAMEWKVDGVEVRMRHPKTGDTMDTQEEKSVVVTKTMADGGMVEERSKGKRRLNLFPVRIHKKGNYGYAVDWADGAMVIYSMRSLAKVAMETGKE